MPLFRPLHLDTRALQVIQPGGMGGKEVIVVEAVLDQQLPVRTDVVLLRAVDDLHATGRRLIEHEVDVFARRPQILREGDGVGIEIEEHEAAIPVDARRLH